MKPDLRKKIGGVDRIEVGHDSDGRHAAVPGAKRLLRTRLGVGFPFLGPPPADEGPQGGVFPDLDRSKNFSGFCHGREFRPGGLGRFRVYHVGSHAVAVASKPLSVRAIFWRSKSANRRSF